MLENTRNIKKAAIQKTLKLKVEADTCAFSDMLGFETLDICVVKKIKFHFYDQFVFFMLRPCKYICP